MREEAPVYAVPGSGFFIVRRYEDAKAVLDNEELFSSNQPPGLLQPPTPEIEQIQREGYPPVNTLLTNADGLRPLERDRPQRGGQAHRGEALLDDRLGAVQGLYFRTRRLRPATLSLISNYVSTNNHFL